MRFLGKWFKLFLSSIKLIFLLCLFTAVIEYLREESHEPQRIGAIGLSGLAGYILGMRRGTFRRIFYGCCGALGMAAVCYPNEAVDYLESVVLETRRYFIIAYHFIYGGKEGRKVVDM